MEIVKLKMEDLELNTGQIDGLPVNPRECTQSDIDSLAHSLAETPELFEARPIIVVPHEGKYVILGGNLRYEASRKNKAKEVPCVVFPGDTPIDKMKEIVIKDNGSWGKWSYDALANEWDDLPLGDWGVPAWDPENAANPDDYGTGFSLQNGEKAPFQQMAFTLADEQAQMVKEALAEAKKTEDYKCKFTYGNENGNGNALSLIIEQWLEQRK